VCKGCKEVKQSGIGWRCCCVHGCAGILRVWLSVQYSKECKGGQIGVSRVALVGELLSYSVYVYSKGYVYVNGCLGLRVWVWLRC